MKLIRLKIIDFQSYQESEIIFTPSQMVFITGINRDTGSSNGCGKSAIKEAILFGLTGKTKVRGEEMIRRGCSECCIEIDLEDQGKLIQITRRKKGSTSILNVSIGGLPLKGTLSEVQTQMEKRLRFDHETLINYNVIDSIRFTDLGDLSSTDLRVILQDLIGLQRLQVVVEKLKDYKNSLDRYIEKKQTRFFPSSKRFQILTSSKVKFEQQLSKLQDTVTQLSRSDSQYSTQYFSLTRDKDNISKAQEKIITQTACPLCNHSLSNEKKVELLNQYQIDLDTLEKTRGSLKSQIEGLQPQLKEYTQSMNQVQARLLKCMTRLTQLNESQKSQKSIDEVFLEVTDYIEAIDIIQQYITTGLTTLAIQVEDQMNADLTRLTDFYCKINLDQTTYRGVTLPNCKISIFRGDFEYSYNMLSSGERVLVALVFRLVLSNLKGISDLLIVDEGLDKLDDLNRERVLSLLESSPYQQIFLISHREDSQYIKSPNRLLVKKDQGISSIVSN